MRFFLAMLCWVAMTAHAQAPAVSHEAKLEKLLMLRGYPSDAKRAEKAIQESVPSSLALPAAMMLDELTKTREVTQAQRTSFLVEVTAIKVTVNTAPLKQLALSRLRGLTAKELDESIAFFQTPAGAKLVGIEQSIADEWQNKADDLLNDATSSALPELGKMIEKLSAQSIKK